MNIFEFTELILDKNDAIEFLREREIIRSDPPICPNPQCDREMTQVKRNQYLDGVVWRCPIHKGRQQSIRKDSFLENQNLEPKEFLMMAYLWAHGTPSHIQESLTGLSRPTVIQWNQYFRDICSLQLINHPIRIGGPGITVQIDESLMAKRKNNQGHIVEKKWVFGMYDCQRRVGILRFVPNRTEAILFPLIQQLIRSGSIIHSDRFSVYVNNNAGVVPPPSRIIPRIPVNPPYQHVSVNHCENFVDPLTNACTNNVEAFWKNAKKKNKEMCGTTPEKLPSYLDEFMWRQKYGKKSIVAFDNLLEQISYFYPVNI